MKKNIRAFTLVELLIASSIFLVVMLTIYSAFHTGIFAYRNIDKTINTYQTARQVLERMNLDLRTSIVYSDQEAQFTGNKNEVSFLTLTDTFSKDTLALAQDYAFVSYQLAGDKLMRLCRKNKECLNYKSKIEPEEMAFNIEELNFSYGYINAIDKSLKFKDSWAGQDAPGEEAQLPVAIKVKLSLKDKIRQDFERTIFLPLAKAQ